MREVRYADYRPTEDHVVLGAAVPELHPIGARIAMNYFLLTIEPGESTEISTTELINGLEITYRQRVENTSESDIIITSFGLVHKNGQIRGVMTIEEI